MHSQSVFLSVSQLKYCNSNSYHRLLLLLSGDINLNSGPFCNLQASDLDDWNIFKHRRLPFLHLSINSLLPKIGELRHIAKLTKAAVIGISESKLDDSVLTSEIQIIEYDLLCCDRSRYGGGVACYIRRTSSAGGGGRERSGPLPFFDTVQTVPSNSSTNFEETLWKINLKNERIDQDDVSTGSWSFLLKFFSTNLRRILNRGSHQ